MLLSEASAPTEKTDSSFLYGFMTAADRQTGFHLSSGWAWVDRKIHKELLKKKIKIV